MWRGRLDVALDALAVQTDPAGRIARSSPMETTTVLLPTGDRLQIPTGAETLRLKGFLAVKDKPGAVTVNRWRKDFLSDWRARMDRAQAAKP